jgi:prepilin-type N-terminal cleavage/methylation domain-containing protein
MNRQHPSGGFSLVELAITVAIFGILAVLSIAMMENFVPAWRTRSAALRFAADLNRIRIAAIKDGVQYRLSITDYDHAVNDANVDSVGAWQLAAGNKSYGSTTWDVLPVELNDKTGDGEGTIVISKGGTNELPWVSIEQPTITSVVFSPRGWVDNAATDFTEDGGYITYTFVNKRVAIDGGADNWVVKISRGGIVRVEATHNLWTGNNTVGTEITGGPSTNHSGYVGPN